jgi:hypothetical protein
MKTFEKKFNGIIKNIYLTVGREKILEEDYIDPKYFYLDLNLIDDFKTLSFDISAEGYWFNLLPSLAFHTISGNHIRYVLRFALFNISMSLMWEDRL